MEVFVTGASGFVGRALCKGLLKAGHVVTALSRSSESAARLPRGVGFVLGDPTRPGPWQEEAARHQGFVNLAGTSIFGRWTEDHKRSILRSRLGSTRNLVQAVAARRGQPTVLLSASAVGYYGSRGDEELDETAPAGEGFLARVCRRWEEEAGAAADFGARVVCCRLGIVLGRGGGALEQMLPWFRRGLGGRLGSGRQWFSWVHLADVVAAAIFCLENAGVKGAVNFTAPRPVTNRQFTRALAHALGRPAFLPVPALAIRLMLGEFGSVLLEGQRAVPARLLAEGFNFRFPHLEDALAELVGRS